MLPKPISFQRMGNGNVRLLLRIMSIQLVSKVGFKNVNKDNVRLEGVTVCLKRGFSNQVSSFK